MHTAILREFGLTNNEIGIFLALSRKGALGASALARETGLNRPYLYYALERLLEKGYVAEAVGDGHRAFRAVPVKQIVTLEEHKLALLREAAHGLEQLSHHDYEPVDIEVLKGARVIKSIFKRLLLDVREAEEVLYLGLDEQAMESLEPLYLRRLLSSFKQARITERAIIKRGSKKLRYATTTRYRSLEPALIGNAARIIYGETVIDVIYGTPLHAIIVRNGQLADTARRQFELLWRHAKPER